MEEFNVNHVDEKQIEEIKNEGNDMFKNKKYKEAISTYLKVVSYLSNGSQKEIEIKDIVKYFKKKNTEHENGGNENDGSAKDGSGSHWVNVKTIFIKICHNISLCYYFLEKFEKSIEYCLYINDMDMNHSKSYHTLGLCYEKLKDYKKCIAYFDKCKTILSKEKTNKTDGTRGEISSNKAEIDKINDRLKIIIKQVEDSKNVNTTTLDTIKNVILDKNSTEENKIKMLHSIYNQKFYLLIKENILKFLFDIINDKNNYSLRVERNCLYVIYKILSKLESENMSIEKEKIKNAKSSNSCISTLDDIKFKYYYDADFVKLLSSFNEHFDEEWISNYIKNKTNKLENLKFDKEKEMENKEDPYNLTTDTLVYILNIVKYVHAINNEKILKIINLYYANSDNSTLQNNALSVIIFMCKKKKFFIQSSIDKEKKESTKKFLDTLNEKYNIDTNNYVVDFHFSDSYKNPVCINSEIKKLIQNFITMYDSFPIDVEYSIILLITLLSDKNRPTEKDTEIGDLIHECVDLYFHNNEIKIEWFVFVKCLFLVDKGIVLNYLIGKTEYMLCILTFINNSIGREAKKHISLYIDVLLLLMNIPELRFMLSNYIDVYVSILKMLNYDENFLKLLIGAFKLYMHNADFKEKIAENIDLFTYSKEMLKEFLLNYNNQEQNTDQCSSTSKVNKNETNNEKREDSNLDTDCAKNKKRSNITYSDDVLKDIIEMLFYLSLHIEFKKQLLEEKNNYILFFLIKAGEDINKKKLDNTYKYIYCNTINNLILTREDEKLRRREINKTNLANFDNEQIEALEQFYNKLPNTAGAKNDPLYDYGDSETSKKIISLLLFSEKYNMNINKNNTISTIANNKYKNGTIINTIYNFINNNFFTKNIAESICEIISKFVKDNSNIGTVLINNGLKALLLCSKHITNKKNCSLALCEIFINTNPKLIHFYEAYDSLPLLIDQLNNDEELLIFKSLMAITNILTIDENVAIKAMNLNLWGKCFDTLSSENQYIRSASLECICNLCSQTHVHQYIYDKYQKIVKKNENNKEIDFVEIQIIYAFTMEYDNYKAVFASTGALGMLSSDLRLPFYLVQTKSFNQVFTSFHKTDDQNILLRILTFFNNIILSENIPIDVIDKIKKTVKEKTGLNEENTQIANLILN
ncbi:hypothetical protein YYG_00882 [Plasmodium vinckei petteri]|uniref:Tetratricopeptide repeat protein, putative n=1 Tax=Plasmodium vinckei petteri TaxID=138298 RepID=W7AJW6_PLAVN|nr:hypothetical protein YYG_00882 [Plasmodium vinckei petteri]CAD2106976.1 tetratricopeptide repeat protein, putative [Plasmodium vinckei petteri]